MRITVIGTGYVGLVTGTCLAELGHDVCCMDIDGKKIEALQQGKVPIYEPGLEELIDRNRKNGRLRFSSEAAESIQTAEVVFNAVGTPQGKEGETDLSAVFSVARTFAGALERYTVLINKSTVPLGTTYKVQAIIQEELMKRGKSSQECTKLFQVVDNPEFLREGAAIKDFLNPDRIVVGIQDDRSRELLERLYRPLVRAGKPILFTDICSSELIKYAANAFLATKISFINEMALYCDRVGADIRLIAKGIGMDSRIGSRFLHSGIGYGGSCFPKDLRSLIYSGRQCGLPFKLLEATEVINEKQKLYLVEKIRGRFQDLRGKTFAVWGLSFKPRTDDVREAPALVILPALKALGVSLKVFDPVAMQNARAVLGDEGLSYVSTREEALEGADALLILTEWDEFRTLVAEDLKRRMKTPIIFDGRNVYDRKDLEREGIEYNGIGV